MIPFLLMLGVLVFCTTGGEIAITYGTKRIGELESFHPRDLLRFALSAAMNQWIWLAIPLMAAAFYSQLILLSWMPISLVIPASASTYVVGALGARYILHETVSPKRWLGVGLVCIGVALVVSTGN